MKIPKRLLKIRFLAIVFSTLIFLNQIYTITQSYDQFIKGYIVELSNILSDLEKNYHSHPSYKKNSHTEINLNNIKRVAKTYNINLEHFKIIHTNAMSCFSKHQLGGSLYKPELHITIPYDYDQHLAISGKISIPISQIYPALIVQLIFALLLSIGSYYLLIYTIRIIVSLKKKKQLQIVYHNTLLHELKRPIQTTIMCMSFIKKEINQTQTRSSITEAVNDAISELEHIITYLQTIQSISQMQEASITIRSTTFDIKKEIKKEIKKIRHIHKKSEPQKQITITTNLEKPDLIVTGDSIHLLNIISNLIENSIKYSKEEVTINASFYMIDHVFHIEISDNGFGINQDDQKRLFEPFYRGANKNLSIPGIGLGLCYVKLVVEAHKGSIDLTSTPDVGTTFHIKIPQ